MDEQKPIYSHNPYHAEGFPLLVLDVKRQLCQPFNEGFRVLHWHNEIQFIYVIEGMIHAKIYDTELDVSAGNCLFINFNALHLIAEKENCRYHSFLIPEQMLAFFSGSTMQQKEVHPVIHNPVLTYYLLSANNPEHQTILAKIQELDTTYFSGDRKDHFEYRISIMITVVWLELIKLLPDFQEGYRNIKYERIQTLLSFIHANYRETISIKEIARSASISKTECVRCFQKFIGESPYQYLIKYRLQASVSLLRNTENSVTDIAAEVGFHSVSAYISHFQKQYRTTPAKFRRQPL